MLTTYKNIRLIMLSFVNLKTGSLEIYYDLVGAMSCATECLTPENFIGESDEPNFTDLIPKFRDKEILAHFLYIYLSKRSANLSCITSGLELDFENIVNFYKSVFGPNGCSTCFSSPPNRSYNSLLDAATSIVPEVQRVLDRRIKTEEVIVFASALYICSLLKLNFSIPTDAQSIINLLVLAPCLIFEISRPDKPRSDISRYALDLFSSTVINPSEIVLQIKEFNSQGAKFKLASKIKNTVFKLLITTLCNPKLRHMLNLSDSLQFIESVHKVLYDPDSISYVRILKEYFEKILKPSFNQITIQIINNLANTFGVIFLQIIKEYCKANHDLEKFLFTDQNQYLLATFSFAYILYLMMEAKIGFVKICDERMMRCIDTLISSFKKAELELSSRLRASRADVSSPTRREVEHYFIGESDEPQCFAVSRSSFLPFREEIRAAKVAITDMQQLMQNIRDAAEQARSLASIALQYWEEQLKLIQKLEAVDHFEQGIVKTGLTVEELRAEVAKSRTVQSDMLKEMKAMGKETEEAKREKVILKEEINRSEDLQPKLSLANDDPAVSSQEEGSSSSSNDWKVV